MVLLVLIDRVILEMPVKRFSAAILFFMSRIKFILRGFLVLRFKRPAFYRSFQSVHDAVNLVIELALV